MPRIGFGTFLIQGDTDAKVAIKAAINEGYRHLDFAAFYKNETEIGNALEEVFKEGKVKREDLFLTTKVSNPNHAPDNLIDCFNKQLSALKLAYIDLYLMHWPFAFEHGDNLIPKDEQGKIKFERTPVHVTWKAMEQLVKEGRTRSIGVSNFPCALIQDLSASAEIPISVNQVELNPFVQQPLLVDYCGRQNILVTAYAPLGKLGTREPGTATIANNETITRIAKKHNRTNAQVTLRWNIQRAPNISIIPKSSNPARIKENFNITDFALDAQDMEDIAALDVGKRVVDAYAMYQVPLFN